MNSELRARVLAAAAAEPSPTRESVRRRSFVIALVGLGSGVVAFLCFAAIMSQGRLLGLGGEPTPARHVERSLWLVTTTAAGALAIATTALWVAVGRGDSMLGRPRRWLVSAAVAIPIGLFVWKIASSLLFGDPMLEWPQRPGFKCFSLSLLVAVGPLLSLLALRRSAPVQPALNGAVMGFAAGACAWVAVDVWCPISYVPHLLLGHLTPLFLLAGVGAVLGRVLLPPRSPARRVE